MNVTGKIGNHTKTERFKGHQVTYCRTLNITENIAIFKHRCTSRLNLKPRRMKGSQAKTRTFESGGRTVHLKVLKLETQPQYYVNILFGIFKLCFQPQLVKPA